jgi:uroporphyrinogen decarboxylase
MANMTTKERVTRMFEHKDADRVPIIDNPWWGTLARWKQEGMPQDMDWRDYFQVDKTAMISTEEGFHKKIVDNSPRYEKKVLEETDKYWIGTTEWGVTLRNFKIPDSTPEFLDYRVTTPEQWEEAKARMKPSRDRINWDYLKTNYPKWQADGAWIEGMFWFGFDVLHSWMVGTETILIALLEDPEWVSDMINTFLDASIGLFEMIWDEGYHFDSIFWYDDMGYKNSTFFSNDVYAKIVMPAHKRAVDWAHNRGIKARLHSCGDIMTRVPQLLEVGIDALNPIEIKAGMDIKFLKQNYGDKLVLHGGANALFLDQTDKILPYIEEMLPMVKENGGYIFASDHSIPNTVSLETFKAVVETVKKYGAY